MKQTPLFDESPNRGAIKPLGVAGSSRTLSKAQKQFNRLIAKIETQRQALLQWKDFAADYAQLLNERLRPIEAQMAARQLEMAHLLDRTMTGKGLSKTQRAKLDDLLMNLLTELSASFDDDEFNTLYDKYCGADDEIFADDPDAMREIARDVFGIELGPDDDALDPETLRFRLEEQLRSEETVGADRPGPHSGRRGGKSEKTQAREALREQALHGATRAMREVYRKLASALHPDREPDADARARKTGLMQEVNQAYEARDLLSLLQLQLKIEQIDAAVLADMADERLAHYNHVLEDQSQQLADELADLMEPFRMAMGRVPGRLTPDKVRTAIEDDARSLESALRVLEQDLIRFQDLRELKLSLRSYRIADFDDDTEAALFIAELMGTRHRSRRR